MRERESARDTHKIISETYIEEYNSETSNVISKDVEQFVNKLNKDPETPKHIKEYTILQKNLIEKENFFKDIKHFIYLFLKGKIFQEAAIAFKKNKKPFLRSQLNNLEYFFFLKKIKKKKQRITQII